MGDHGHYSDLLIVPIVWIEQHRESSGSDKLIATVSRKTMKLFFLIEVSSLTIFFLFDVRKLKSKEPGSLPSHLGDFYVQQINSLANSMLPKHNTSIIIESA